MTKTFSQPLALNLTDDRSHSSDETERQPLPKQLYCLGLYFHRDVVLLVRKSQPMWQRGLWNGIGGHIQRGEFAADAMVREFREETGLETKEWRLAQPNQEGGWRHFCTQHGSDYRLTCFSCIRPLELDRPVIPDCNDRGERLAWMHWCTVLQKEPVMVGTYMGGLLVIDLTWMIPLALDWRRKSVIVHNYDDIVNSPAAS